MDSTWFRSAAYISSFGLITAFVLTLLAAHGRPLRFAPWRFLIAALILYGFFFLLLALSMKEFDWLPRLQLGWVFGALAGGGSVLGWPWLLMTMRLSFRIERRDGDILSYII